MAGAASTGALSSTAGFSATGAGAAGGTTGANTGVIARFVYLDFDELRILPDFGSAEPTVADRVSFRLSARLLFIVAAALRVLYEFWREKVLDVFL